MPYDVAVDFSPTTELIVSLQAYLHRKLHKTLDLGSSWATQVRKELSPDLRDRLSSIKNLDTGVSILHHLLAAEGCPEPRTPHLFLGWLASLSPGEIYERVSPQVWPNEMELPADLGAWRDQMVRLLADWHHQYFQHVDPAVLDGLRTSAEQARQLVGTLPPAQVVERVTNGLYIDLGEEELKRIGVERILLLPQYHYRPINLIIGRQGTAIILYPAEDPTTAPGEPSSDLLRMTRALSEPSRLRILRQLRDGPRTFTELARLTSLAQSTVYHHLVILRAAGLVRVHLTVEKLDQYSLRPAAIDLLHRRLTAYLEGE